MPERLDANPTIIPPNHVIPAHAGASADGTSTQNQQSTPTPPPSRSEHIPLPPLTAKPPPSQSVRGRTHFTLPFPRGDTEGFRGDARTLVRQPNNHPAKTTPFPPKPRHSRAPTSFPRTREPRKNKARRPLRKANPFPLPSLTPTPPPSQSVRGRTHFSLPFPRGDTEGFRGGCRAEQEHYPMLREQSK